jgi:F0F1-type ATP synthase assembly protein I
LNSLSEKLEDMQKDNEKLVKSKELIDESTNDAKALLQKLKAELENQEEEIRDKESRINRLETLSLIYRLSKFFGGILIGVGIFFIILAIGDIFNFIDFGGALIEIGDFDMSFISLLLLISAGFMIISGIFHLEKS